MAKKTPEIFVLTRISKFYEYPLSLAFISVTFYNFKIAFTTTQSSQQP